MNVRFTTAEVAERLRISTDEVRKLCNTDELGHLRIGCKYVIPEEDLQAFEARSYRPAVAGGEQPRLRAV
ncbi:helix-turn-helix domain-containing protein [Glycomyces tenuis]|uniref:helix-turn-helix domain-containing protein n=1 Tax=Glycomyces tenuis TaxID=58116 RepID=UPI00042788B2|nr:helix-turn-helix domain-containing protein [Glycomyces tenuis]